MSSEASALTTESAVEEPETVDVPTEEALDESSQLVVPGLGSWLYETDDTEKVIYMHKYTGKDERIKVPATYTINGQSYAVKLAPRNASFSLPDGVFGDYETSYSSNPSQIKEVEFEEGVGGDFDFCFYCCSNLIKANIPSGITDCTAMFMGCSSLEEAPVIPSSVTSCVFMFDGCSSLKEAPVIPSGVTSCGSMFMGCSSLTTAPSIPVGVTSCWCMFAGCSSLTTAPSIPASVVDCGEMFARCSKLSGSMDIMGKIGYYSGSYRYGVSGMFEEAATEGSGLTIYYADGVNIDEILATKSANSKITAKPLSENPTPAPVNPTPSAPSSTKVATYNGDTFYQGSDGNLRCYDNSNQLVTNEFKCDGTYTYYMQADGTPMKDRLTYHPDGEHIIYLDENGHEVFTNFQYCPSVGYICYFDAQGYLYKDQITFVGDKTYYLNGNGAMEQSGWFQFANGLDYGCANSDGTLVTTGFSYDPYGRVVFIKDIIFEINGWNLRATLAEYWNQLLESQKIYMLYEDRSKRIPRLWILRGGSCGDVADWAGESLLYYSEEECISLSDEQCKEILEKRTVKDNEECSYEVVSAPLFMPWKEDHLYEMSLRMIDLSYYKEEVMEKLIGKDRDRIMILPEDIKACERKYVKKIVSCKEKIEKVIAGIIK